MANHFSALKRTRQTEKRTAVNRASKSRLRTALRELRSAMDQGDKGVAENKFREATSILDKSVQKGVVHKNTASRYKARLAARVAAVGGK
jgi:small subunit ribosomal protein S20